MSTYTTTAFCLIILIDKGQTLGIGQFKIDGHFKLAKCNACQQKETPPHILHV